MLSHLKIIAKFLNTWGSIAVACLVLRADFTMLHIQ